MPQGQSYPINFLRQDNNFNDPFVNNLSPNNPSYPYVSILNAWLAAAAAGVSFRILLTAPTSFFFDTVAGNDANPGTNAQPWASPAPLGSRYDFGGQTVTLNLKNSPNPGNILIPVWVGGGSLILDLGGHTVTAIGGNDCIDLPLASISGPLTVQNGTLTCGAGVCLFARAPGSVVNIGPNLTFGAAPGGFHIWATRGCSVRLINNYSVAGGAFDHWRADHGGLITNDFFPITVFGGAFNFSNAFAQARDNGVIDVPGVTFPAAGAGNWSGATGQKFDVTTNSTIDTRGAGINAFPGNIAGTSGTNGIYA